MDTLQEIIDGSIEFADIDVGQDECIDLYCEEYGISECIAEQAKALAFKQGALEAGIPLAVIEGRASINDYFSDDYIRWKAGK